MSSVNCIICGMLDSEKPMTFRGYPYCSDKCKKRLAALQSEFKKSERLYLS